MLLQDKKRALEIYNAMNETAYDDPELVEITTLEDRSFSLTVRNDASFVLDHHLSLYEHQSTLCPNMPLRDLIHFAAMIQKRVYNINKGNNGELLARCPTLRDYMYFIDAVREYHTKNNFTDLEGAVEQAISQCIRENVLKEFLTEHRMEVTHVMTMDYTFERRLEFQREEAIEEGREEGREEGMQKKLHELIRKKLFRGKSLEQIAEELEVK